MTQDFSGTNTWALLVAATLLLLVLWGLRVLKTGTAAFAWNGTTKRMGLLAIAALASLLVSPNKIEALLAHFGVGTLLLLFLLSLVAATFLDEKSRHILRWVLMTGASIAGLLVIYQFFGLGTFIGTSVDLMTILLVTLPLLVGELHHRKKSGHDSSMMVAIAMIVASLGGLILTAYQILPTWEATTLPYWANWQILLESYKDWRHLLVGVGAENFLAAFTTGRPASLNMTALWNTRFTLGSSLAFHIATVYGLLGAAAFGWFLTKAHPIAILSFLFLPPSFPALIVVAALFIVSESAHLISLKGSHPSRLIAIVVFLVVGAASYGLYRTYGAQLAFGRSLAALESRDGTGAYNLQIRAITLSPRVTRFHTAYSQTNLALANAISGAATSSATPEQVDRDRQTATQLIQQAIREAKIGVSLAPTNILAWENLAAVYQTLTGVAQGADQWTVASYQQAVTIDPTNPVLRLRLGGAYVGQQQLDRAEETYKQAIQLKPDYANAYYNLAFVYRELKKYGPAAFTLKQALKFVTPGSDDAARANKELEELRELLTEEEKQALDERTTPPVQSNTAPEPLSPLP